MRVQSINYLHAVATFMNKHGQAMRAKPSIPNIEELMLRSKLIEEEAKETCAGIAVCETLQRLDKTFDQRDPQVTEALIQVADGIADSLYVLFGTALAFGLPIESVFAEVHRSNMSKPKLGHTNVGVKVEKGNYSRPQIGAILESFR